MNTKKQEARMDTNKRTIIGYSINLSGRGIWEPRYRRWGQLNYSYTSNYHGHPGTTSSFRSIVWLDGDWHAYKMWPYLCYSGDRPIKYRRLSGSQTLGIYAIAAKTIINNITRWVIPRYIRSAKYSIINTIKSLNPLTAYRTRKARKEADQFWAELGL